MSSEIRELFELHNHQRVQQQASRLHLDDRLLAAARKHALWMAAKRKLSHTGEDGSSVGSRVRDEGYTARALGENIAAGQRTSQQVFDAWMNSFGHRRNILNSSFSGVGLAVADADANGRQVRFWCVVLGDVRHSASSEAEPVEDTPDGLLVEKITVLQEE